MARLVVSCGDEKPRHVIVRDDAVLVMGRGEENGLVLEDDFASRNHAELRFEGDKYIVKDLGSTNGTYVNDKPITEKELVDGDKITIGRHDIVFHCTDEDPCEPTVAIRTTSNVEEDVERIKHTMASVGERLSLMAGADSGVDESPTKVAGHNMVTIGKAYRRLEVLYEAARLAVSELDLSKRLELIMDSAIRVTGADRGFIVLVDEEGGSLRIETARKMGSDAAQGSPSMGIASRSAIHGELMLVEDALQDVRFSSRESVILGQIHCAMSVPLKVEERILGSIYVDSRRLDHCFGHEDLELFEALASQSAIAIENAQLTEKMIEEERRRCNMERFLSPRVVEQVICSPGAIELGGTKQEITALFSDIRGFTGLAERMPPGEVVSLLNEYFTDMAEVIFRHEGTLDKYVGDEIMAVFGAPVSFPGHSLRAATVALEMQQELCSMRERWVKSNRPAFEVGIGIATGTAIAGYVGSPKRMEFTSIGDIVNVARRLCGKAEPGQILVCEKVSENISEHVNMRSLGPVVLKGKEKEVSVYEVLGLK
jgi:adenylate cyclase